MTPSESLSPGQRAILDAIARCGRGRTPRQLLASSAVAARYADEAALRGALDDLVRQGRLRRVEISGYVRYARLSG